MPQETSAFEHALQRAQEDQLDAFVTVVEPADSQPQQTSGVLAGIPYAVKDNIDTVDLPTSANTPALVGTQRDHDHEIVTRLNNAGALMVGKTNLHELAFGITTGAAAHPATRNPFDPSRSPGGSSGGSGAAVGSGIVHLRSPQIPVAQSRFQLPGAAHTVTVLRSAGGPATVVPHRCRKRTTPSGSSPNP